MMINLKRFAVHTLLLVLLIVLIYVPSFALISFTGQASVSEKFSDSARIASVPVGGMTRDEAKPKVQKAIMTWSNMTPLTMGTGEDVTPIPTTLVTFKADQAIQAASLKKGGKLSVSTDDAAIEDYLSTQPVAYTAEQTTQFKTWLTKMSQELKEGNYDPTTVTAATGTDEVVSSISFTTRSAAEEQMVEAMTQVELKAGQLMNTKTYGMDPVAASYIGSKLYELFAKTPFEIVERMPHDQLPDGITLGYDVRIDEKTDFAVRNTQASSYQLVATKTGSDVTLELRGTPFKETMTAVLEGEKSIPYRTITRYSATLSAGTTSDTQSGEDGKSIELYRLVKSNKGEQKTLIALDFYAATPAIVTKSSQTEQPPVVTPPAEEKQDETTDQTDSESDTTDQTDPESDVTSPDEPVTPDTPTSPDTPDAPTSGDPASPVEDDSAEPAVG